MEIFGVGAQRRFDKVEVLRAHFGQGTDPETSFTIPRAPQSPTTQDPLGKANARLTDLLEVLSWTPWACVLGVCEATTGEGGQPHVWTLAHSSSPIRSQLCHSS